MLFQYVTLSPPTDEALNYIVFFQSNLQKWLCDIKSPEVAKKLYSTNHKTHGGILNEFLFASDFLFQIMCQEFAGFGV